MSVHPLTNAELTLETERLILRPYAEDDIDLSHALLSDPKVMRYLGPIKEGLRVEEEHAKVIRRGAGGRIGVWCVVLKETGEKIGDVVLTPLPIDVSETDWESVIPERYPDAEIETGYTFLPTSWGHGYATEATKRILQFGFELTTLTKIVAVTDPENTASMHVLKKCGLHEDGFRHAYREKVTAFSLNRNDWLAQNA